MNYDELNKTIKEIQSKYNLVDFGFDTEYIYNLGDLSGLLKGIIEKTIPEKNIVVTERISDDGKYYIATLSNSDTTLSVYTEKDIDWLSDDFIEKLYEIPKVFKSNKRYYMINPAIGLTGQDAWYFCGTEEQLKNARKRRFATCFPRRRSYGYGRI